MNPLKSVAKKLLSKRQYYRLGDWAARLRKPLRTLWYHGREHYCPCCGGSFRGFKFDGVDVCCPACRSFSRHRLLSLYLQRKGLLEGRLKLLEIAPMRCSRYMFQGRRNVEYLSADLESPRAMVRMDLTRIDLPDDQFDSIICYHVLEHIPDDRKAVAELFRILKPGGWAIIDVPMVAQPAEKTFEDSRIVSPAERKKYYGTEEHLRLYGRDYADRLRAAGFEVLVDGFASTLTPEEIAKYGIRQDAVVYFCRKGATRW